MLVLVSLLSVTASVVQAIDGQVPIRMGLGKSSELPTKGSIGYPRRQDHNDSPWNLDRILQSSEDVDESQCGTGRSGCRSCQGHCESDRHCRGPHRVCFFRTGDEDVPGCRLASLSTGTSYCYFKPILRSRRVCSSSSPCRICQGLCTVDEDCEGGLTCFQRQGRQKVPGCRGRGRSGAGYCHMDFTIAPSEGTETPSVSIVPSQKPTSIPSTSLTPSKVASMEPSLSSTPSVLPSASILPSMGPSTEPSASTIPSTSLTPSKVASMEPSHSSTPSVLPSASIPPSIGPSTVPSASTIPSTSVVPTKSPVTFTGNFIRAAESSESVTIPDPDPPQPDTQTNCPHHATGLSQWTYGSSGDITLDEGVKVLLTSSIVGTLGVITIPETSELIFDDVVGGISLDCEGMDVKGRLIAGSETCRIHNSITITLHGDRPDDVVTNIPSPIVKGISVSGPSAMISLHGKRYYRTWSRLAAPMEAGVDDIAMVQHEVNWEAGQEVVIVTTAMRDSIDWHQNEVRTVQGALNDPLNDGSVGAAVFLDAPVTYHHSANRYYQAEIGLLTRTIKIQGSALDSEPDDPDPLTCDGPCNGYDLTGYGGHIIVHDEAVGQLSGVELYRMGQTNVLGRYPFHFHLLGDCPSCYFKDSSVHRSYYRCISIHGTNEVEVSENVGYDVRGFCYYLEDGVERFNKIHFNLGAFIHFFAPYGDVNSDGSEGPFRPGGQRLNFYRQSVNLTLPADIAASAYYITNIHNEVVGNAASGGWAGFAIPILLEPLGQHRNDFTWRPNQEMEIMFDGNTAHSTGHFWSHASAFYWGGALFFDDTDDVLTYNPGRDWPESRRPDDTPRQPCLVNEAESGWCSDSWKSHWIRQTNSKAFLVKGSGLNSWSGRMEIVGFEAHDVSLAVEALEGQGFWVNDALIVCRTGETLEMPDNPKWVAGSAFRWYDTGQEHIVTNWVVRNCGYRSDEFIEYDDSPDRGCGSDELTGCHPNSAVFTVLSHSDQFNPEVMAASSNMTFDNCGRRFRFTQEYPSVSGRIANWIDADGSVTLMGGPSVIASAYESSGLWWTIDDYVVLDTHGPVQFLDMKRGPERDVAHIKLHFDSAQHNQVGSTVCGNGGDPRKPCPDLGYVRHLGPKFENDTGLPITAQADIAGPVGGFGWFLTFVEGYPKELKISQVEVKPSTTLLLAIPYPLGASITLTQKLKACDSNINLCEYEFTSVSSVDEVRHSDGDVYYVDSNGVLYVRIIQTPPYHLGYKDTGWQMFDYSDTGEWCETCPGVKLARFEREGILLPKASSSPWLEIVVDCVSSPTNDAYCADAPNPSLVSPDPCTVAEYPLQTAYDTCCTDNLGTECVFANGELSSTL